MKKLLIVESPKKARSIGKFLGNDWIVKASIGHFRDMDAKPKEGIGINDETLRPEYVIQNKKVVAQLKQASKGADEIYLATDPDREGEAISSHLAHVLHIKEPKRVTYQEITKQAVLKAINAPRAIDQALVDAQEARRVLDRIIGYTVSPRLGSGHSAGRVQSPALRLVVKRELQIRDFTPTNHFGVKSIEANGQFSAVWNVKQILKDDEEYLLDVNLANKIAETTELTVTEVEKKQRKANPPIPFITSTLQQAASSHLEMRPEQTMKAAQVLFQDGHITYHRTDSPVVSKEAQENIRAYLTEQNMPIPNRAPSYKAKEGAQEAHECVRVTDITKKVAGSTPEEEKLYRLIRLRTLASQMTPAVFDVATAEFHANVCVDDDNQHPAVFRAKAELLVEHGWKVAIKSDNDTGETEEDEERTDKLPDIKKGMIFSVTSKRENKSTRPPKRYTEATLIKALEDKGIGRPSTYATIFQGLIKRGYMRVQSRKITATRNGRELIANLKKANFSFINYDYTKNLESQLDEIAHGKAEYYPVVSGSKTQLDGELKNLPNMGGRAAPDPRYPCPVCASPMQRIKTKSGVFWGCSGYPKCKQTAKDDMGKPVFRKDILSKDVMCPECDKPLRKIETKKGKAFWGCTGYPDCKVTMEDKDGKPVPRDTTTGPECPACHKGHLQRRTTKGGGAFWGCSNYPKCKMSEVDNDGELITPSNCTKCGHIMKGNTVRKGKNKGRHIKFCLNTACENIEVD